MATSRILIVDDEPSVCELCSLYLEKEQFETKSVHHGNAVAAAVEEFRPDLIVLDIMLPGKDGWQICREVRQESRLPIIMLTARDEHDDRIRGLELGADDYLAKPFNPRELVARVRAVLRRAQQDPLNSRDEAHLLRHGDLKLNLETHQAFLGEHELSLTPKEFDLLQCLLRRPGKTFTRTELLDHIWGYDYFGDERTVDVHVKRLRKKLEAVSGERRYIVTVWGVGYRLGE